MFQSKTFSILDSMFYDEATSSTTKNPNWTPSNVSIAFKDRYTELSKTNSSSNGNYAIVPRITAPCIVEWDNHAETDNYNYLMLGSAFFSFQNRGIDGECHVKIIIEEDKMTPIVDGVAKSSANISETLSDGLELKFRIHSSSTHSIGYSNFKVYPI